MPRVKKNETLKFKKRNNSGYYRFLLRSISKNIKFFKKRKASPAAFVKLGKIYRALVRLKAAVLCLRKVFVRRKTKLPTLTKQVFKKNKQIRGIFKNKVAGLKNKLKKKRKRFIKIFGKTVKKWNKDKRQFLKKYFPRKKKPGKGCFSLKKRLRKINRIPPIANTLSSFPHYHLYGNNLIALSLIYFDKPFKKDRLTTAVISNALSKLVLKYVCFLTLTKKLSGNYFEMRSKATTSFKWQLPHLYDKQNLASRFFKKNFLKTPCEGLKVLLTKLVNKKLMSQYGLMTTNKTKHVFVRVLKKLPKWKKKEKGKMRAFLLWVSHQRQFMAIRKQYFRLRGYYTFFKKTVWKFKFWMPGNNKYNYRHYFKTKNSKFFRNSFGAKLQAGLKSVTLKLISGKKKNFYSYILVKAYADIEINYKRTELIITPISSYTNFTNPHYHEKIPPFVYYTIVNKR